MYDALVRELGNEQVFMDVDDIQPGEDFRHAIARTMEESDVVVVVIGPSWTAVTDEQGARRLDDEADVHRTELESALAADVRIIPVVVGGGKMPSAGELPESLKELSYRNAAVLEDRAFNRDMEILNGAIVKHMHDIAADRAAQAQAEAEQLAEQERQAEAERQAEERQAEERLAEAERQAEQERQAEAERQAEQGRRAGEPATGHEPPVRRQVADDAAERDGDDRSRGPNRITLLVSGTGIAVVASIALWFMFRPDDQPPPSTTLEIAVSVNAVDDPNVDSTLPATTAPGTTTPGTTTPGTTTPGATTPPEAPAAVTFGSVNGFDVSHIVAGNGSVEEREFHQTSPLTWIELVPPNDVVAEYLEVDRDEGSVTLEDSEQDVVLTIDLATARVQSSASPDDPLYEVLNATAVNGWLIAQATVSNGDSSGAFFQDGPTTWYERDADGLRRFEFTETGRDDWSVYLYDASRDIQIQIDSYTQQVKYKDSDTDWVEIYEVVSARSVNGWVVNDAFFGDAGNVIGRYRQVGFTATWEELSPGGDVISVLDEVFRDEWSVYLFDPTRDQSVQIDTADRTIVDGSVDPFVVLNTLLYASS